MYYQQLLEGIQLIGQHPYFTKQSMIIQINIYRIGELINDDEKTELLTALEPQITEEPETPVE